MSTFWLKKAPYLELCSTFKIKTILLIRPLLGSTKGGLNSRIPLYYPFVLKVTIKDFMCMLMLSEAVWY